MTCNDNIANIEPIRYDTRRKAEERVTETDTGQLRSVNGSMGWCIRQRRPDLAYYPSRLQSVTNAAQVKHLKLCNEVLQELQEFCTAGITFKGKAFNWDETILVTMGDASFAREQLVID